MDPVEYLKLGISAIKLLAGNWLFPNGVVDPLHIVTQLAIPFTSIPALWLAQYHDRSVRRWASVVALLGQPFWFITSYKAGQFGVFLSCFVYTTIWCKGFYLNWLHKDVRA